jgi:predicted phage terminase large subunit-like protein
MSVLENKIPIIRPVNPLGSKQSRVVDGSKAMSMVSQCEGGKLYLPHPAIASWTEDFIQEYAIFPRGRHDDQVDAGSQAIQYLTTCADCGLYTASQFESEAVTNEFSM